MTEPPAAVDTETRSRIVCFQCRHLIQWPYCFAFLTGEGIPQEIREGKNIHTTPVPGDHGITFTGTDEPYGLSEKGLKELLLQYAGETVMPGLADFDETVSTYRELIGDVIGELRAVMADFDDHTAGSSPTEETEATPTPTTSETGVTAEKSPKPGESSAGPEPAKPADPSPRDEAVSPRKHQKPDETADRETREKKTDTALKSPDVNDLIRASRTGDINAVREILRQGVDVNARDDDLSTALMAACRTCQVDVVKLLLRRGADVNATDKYSRNALYLASAWGYPSIVEILKAHGADESVKTSG